MSALLTLALLALWLLGALRRRRTDRARHAVAAAYDRRRRVRRPATAKEIAARQAEMAERQAMMNAQRCYPGIMQSPLFTQPIRPSDD